MNSEYLRLKRGTTGDSGSKFMALKSRREQRKRNRVLKYSSDVVMRNDRRGGVEVYDQKGVHKSSGQDLCDCLDPVCTGCFFRCPNKRCKSNKCGSDCRQKRKFYYQSIEDQIEDTKRDNDIAIRYDPELNVIEIN